MLVTLPGMVIEVKEEQQEFVALIDNLQVASNTVEKSWRCGGEGEKGKDLTSFNLFDIRIFTQNYRKSIGTLLRANGLF